jgi:hypothetical protein
MTAGRNGPAQAAQFTWERAAQQLLGMYRSLAHSSDGKLASKEGEV